jgi:hypothetical protein
MKEGDKKRIEEASKKHADKNGRKIFVCHDEETAEIRGSEYHKTNGYHEYSFKAGAEYEHPISYNQAIEDVLTRLMQNWRKKDASEIYDEVEKLKKP